MIQQLAPNDARTEALATQSKEQGAFSLGFMRRSRSWKQGFGMYDREPRVDFRASHQSCVLSIAVLKPCERLFLLGRGPYKFELSDRQKHDALKVALKVLQNLTHFLHRAHGSIDLSPGREKCLSRASTA